MAEVKFLDAQEILKQVSDCIKSSKKVEIAIAYFKWEGLEQIRRSLEKTLRANKTVKIVVGASSDYGITDWRVLGKLLRLRKRYPNLHLRYYDNPGFHPKLFVFVTSKKVKILIGSSNLTGGGLGKNVEANIMLEAKQGEEIAQIVEKEFEFWFSNAPKLTSKVVEDYKKMQRKRAGKLKKSLGLRRTQRKTPLPKRPIKPVAGPFLKERSYWKVAPGKKGCQWTLWEGEIENNIGVIAIGWEFQGIDFGNEERAKELISKRLEGKTGYIYNQGWMFYKKMKKGDVVVAYSNRSIFGIAQIMKRDVWYTPIKDWKRELYPNRREVKWLWREGPIHPPKKYMNVLSRPNDTIHPIEDKDAIAFVSSLLKK